MQPPATHNTNIEWTHVPAGVTSADHPGYRGETWNPVRGCTKVSPGCKHCYAETFAERWRGVVMPDGKPHAYHQGFDLRLVPEKLDEPLRAAKPRAFFVNSMSDLHQDDVPGWFLRASYAVMEAAPRHIFMVLTKRSENMRAAVHDMRSDASLFCERRDSPDAIVILPDHTLSIPYMDGVPSNVWLGVSVEDRKYGLPRVDILRTIPAAVRFLSIEPLLEDLGDIDLSGIHWVIVGGESGHGARPFDIAWARRIVKQCREQSVSVFMKQLGTMPTDGRLSPAGAHVLVPLRSRKGGDIGEWPMDLRVREWPKLY